MFIGHFGLAFAAKKAAPKVSLGTLFIATQFVDILWPFLLIFKIEKVAIVPGYTKVNAFDFLYFPFTHSLLMGIMWGITGGWVYWFFKRETRGAFIVGLAILSHWFLDSIVHITDLPLTPFGEYKIGFGLWNSLLGTFIVETTIFLIGTCIYFKCTKAKNRAGGWGLYVLIALLVLVSCSNTFGPPPSPTGSLMSLLFLVMSMMIIIILLTYWVDNNREVV